MAAAVGMLSETDSDRGGGVGGNVLDFVAWMESCSIRDAALLLRDRFALVSSTIVAARSTPSSTRANPVLSFKLSHLQGQHPYLIARGVDPLTATYFGIGYYAGPGMMSRRVAIPIHNESGELVAYAGRAVATDCEPRYQFPPRFRKSAELFNLHRTRANYPCGLIVVEGFFDCVRVHRAGFRNVVALMGCSMSDRQIDSLLRRECSRVILLLDGDAAGRRGAEDISQDLRHAGLAVTVADVPEGRQPDNLAIVELRKILLEADRR
jgi:DNA primase